MAPHCRGDRPGGGPPRGGALARPALRWVLLRPCVQVRAPPRAPGAWARLLRASFPPPRPSPLLALGSRQLANFISALTRQPWRPALAHSRVARAPVRGCRCRLRPISQLDSGGGSRSSHFPHSWRRLWEIEFLGGRHPVSDHSACSQRRRLPYFPRLTPPSVGGRPSRPQLLSLPPDDSSSGGALTACFPVRTPQIIQVGPRLPSPDSCHCPTRLVASSLCLPDFTLPAPGTFAFLKLHFVSPSCVSPTPTSPAFLSWSTVNAWPGLAFEAHGI
ncbi:uncharacterized protein LOC115518091 [Lynx canadensis]|uniref:uncharacterized protein LOC115518091 n=1 Tax=Lynx canadensis TaxID=61383 RepID=UPI0013C5156E|nr:uncharacterized protein LOC115518091 [Lynx canadensis]